MAVKPTFLIIGAPKCGTTSLWAILRQHPDIHMPQIKEPDYFSRDEVYGRGWEWYTSLFAGARGEAAIGEASPSYCMVQTYPKAPGRINSHLPEAKIIYIVRHPLDRMESAWVQFLHSGHPVSRSFTNSVRQYPLFLEQSMYWQTITAYRKYYPDSNILVLFLRELESDAESVAAACFRFLGVDPQFRVADASVPRNSRTDKRVERPIMGLMRASPACRLIQATFPGRARRWLYRRFGRTPVHNRPRWDVKTRAWAIDRLRDDSVEFLAYAGKPPDYWNLARENEESESLVY